MLQLNAENPPRADVVAVTEAAGNAQNLKFAEQIRGFQQSANVNIMWAAASVGESKRSLFIAVGARRSENENFRLHLISAATTNSTVSARRLSIRRYRSR